MGIIFDSSVLISLERNFGQVETSGEMFGLTGSAISGRVGVIKASVGKDPLCKKDGRTESNNRDLTPNPP